MTRERPGHVLAAAIRLEAAEINRGERTPSASDVCVDCGRTTLRLQDFRCSQCLNVDSTSMPESRVDRYRLYVSTAEFLERIGHHDRAEFWRGEAAKCKA